MSPVEEIADLARREEGGVLVIVALWLPLLVVLGSLVIDVGNWFEHRRHLQLQADAAALAAAGDASGCRKDPVAANALIEERARTYGGVAESDPLNAQVGGTPAEKVHLLLNSQTWFDQPDTVDPTVNTAGPCAAAMVDVKVTETDLPWFFRAARVVPFINAHARVSFMRVGQNRHAAVPIGFPDANPKRGRVQLIDEDTGAVLASAALARVGTDAGQAIWNNAASPLERKIDKERIGVRVVLSGSDSTTCGEPLVECYQQPATSHGSGFIGGYSTAGTVGTTDPPRARDVRLLPGTCPAAYFVAATAGCDIAVDAAVDFGATTDPVGAQGAKVTANVAGSKTSFALSWDATAGRWQSTAAIPVAARGGEIPIELQWERTKGQVVIDGATKTCSTANKNPCTGTFGVVQRALSARDDLSGPIQGLYVTEVDAAGTPVQLNANSFPMCASPTDSCTPRLVVEIRIPNLQAAQSKDAPRVTMRVAGSGSRTQALDCDPDLPNLKQELENGCGAQYVRNTGQACPNNLNGVAQPWRCVAVSTGAAISHMDGLTDRILDGAATCTNPNRWDSYWTDGVVKPDPNDPRLVQVILTPFGAFSSSGGGTVPVMDFAYFYITGWRAEKANPCTGQGDDPAESGFVVGHFVEYVDTLNTGQAANEPCDLSGPGNCVAVLTH